MPYCPCEFLAVRAYQDGIVLGTEREDKHFVRYGILLMVQFVSPSECDIFSQV